MKKSKVYIIGAGFSGLTLAYRMALKGFQVSLYDQNDRSGGLIQSKAMTIDFAETAAPSLSLSERVHKLCLDLNVDILYPTKSSKKRWIYRDRPTRWPLTFLETFLLIFKVIFHKLKGDLKPKPGETIHLWGHRIIGASATHYLLETALQGIYAGDGMQLSASLLIGALFNPQREKFKGVIGFKGGMSSLISALEKAILSNKGKFFFGKKISLQELKEFQKAEPGPIILATSALEAGRLLANSTDPVELKLSKNLLSIEMCPIITTTIHYPMQKLKTEGFGCLIPRKNQIRTLGILFNTDIFNRTKVVRSETWLLGGATDPTCLDLTDGELLKLIATERKSILENEQSPIDHKITRWPTALPHYNLELERLLPAIQSLELEIQSQNLFITGNYLGGLGLSKILERNDKLANKLESLYD